MLLETFAFSKSLLQVRVCTKQDSTS